MTAVAGPVPVAGFRQAVEAEWLKLRTIRSTVLTGAAAGLVVPVLAVFVAATGSLQDDDTVLGGSLTGAVLGQLLVGVVGALCVATEYAGGTIAATFAAQPRRHVVLAAKAAVVAAVTVPVGLASCGLAYGIGGAMLGDGRAAGDPVPALVGVAACLAVTAVLGVALGALARRPAGAVGAVTAVVLLPSLLAPLLGNLGRWVAGASPSATLQKLTQTSDATPEAVGSLGAWPSLALLALATGAALAGAAARQAAQDV